MSGFAMFLCALGIYGLMAYSLTRRTREVGIRVALGASRWNVMMTLTSKTAVLIGVSCAIGLFFAVVVSRLLSPLLFAEPGLSSYVIAVAVVILAAAGSSVVPVKRALRVEPSSALRYE
jgi:ABC-type antimicrobial peptide transport system permease subunit